MVVLLVAYAYSGWYDVSVGSGHASVTEWFLETLRIRSIEARADALQVPTNLDSDARISRGAGHYREMCVACHGHPGSEPADNLDPEPPALYRMNEEAAEVFWIVKNGIKMTAMPSHKDHSDDELWDIVAFVQRLPELSAEEYEALVSRSAHHHDEGGSEHPHDEANDEHHHAAH